METYTQDELAIIIKSYEGRRDYMSEYKKNNPPSKEQRRQYNREHYLRRKQRPNHKETCQKYESVNADRTKKRKKYYYYKKTNQLEKLNQKYPEIYNMFCE